jgi:uncharacterized protein (TIGR02271 family)
MDSAADRIVPLDELKDFQVAEGDPDVRGWEVLSADGRKIGEVDNLLVDRMAMKVRYLDVDIDDEHLTDGVDRHILVPIGHARLDEDSDHIFVDSLNSTNLIQIPAYSHEPLIREYETSLRQHFDRDFTTTPATNTDFYAHDSYDSDRFFDTRRDNESTITRSEEELAIGRREQRAGEVDIHKRVETEHVRESIPTRREEVIVERRPIEDASMSTSPRIEEDEVRIPVNEEELVVEKRTVPKEEIVVRKQERTENETVEADLRRERIDIDREGDVNFRDNR